jgi:hypothetical protein
MANTPYGKLGSEDILSAHINGLQYGINNVESILNMKTASKTGQALAPVIDMEDNTLRYRIYEATDRNWLTSPAPVIKRNGTAVNSNEYVMQPAYGVVVFNVPQSSSDAITADFTHVTNGSTRLETIEGNVSANASQLSTNTTQIATNTQDIATNKQGLIDVNARVDGIGAQSEVQGVIDPTKTYYANAKFNGTLSNQKTAVNIGMLAGSIDCVPFYVEYPTTFDAIRITVGSTSTSGNVIMGIYDTKDLRPFNKLAETAVTAVSSTSGAQVVNLTAPVVLQAGMYWLCRYNSTAVSLDGYATKNDNGTTGIIEIKRPTNSAIINEGGTNGVFFGVRSEGYGASLTALPTTLPMVGNATNTTRYIKRDTFGLIWARSVKA